MATAASLPHQRDEGQPVTILQNASSLIFGGSSAAEILDVKSKAHPMDTGMRAAITQRGFRCIGCHCVRNVRVPRCNLNNCETRETLRSGWKPTSQQLSLAQSPAILPAPRRPRSKKLTLSDTCRGKSYTSSDADPGRTRTSSFKTQISRIPGLTFYTLLLRE